MEEIVRFAPVIIPTLCRYEHFRRCVESLAACTHADKTDLIIGLDYPVSDSQWDGYNKINAYVDTIEGFRTVTILRADHNWGVGPGGNLSRLGVYVREKSDRYIVSEDDNEFAPAFLDFMNKALLYYEKDPSVSSICGFNQYSIENNSVIATYDNSSWGYGRWVSRIHPSKEDTYAYAKSFRAILRLFRRFPAAIPMLVTMVKKGKFYGDLSWTCSNIMNNHVQIRPSVSLVRNWGHDGSGVHCGTTGRFVQTQLPEDKKWEVPIAPPKRTKEVDKMVHDNLLPNRCFPRVLSLIKIFFYGLYYCLLGS